MILLPLLSMKVLKQEGAKICFSLLAMYYSYIKWWSIIRQSLSCGFGLPSQYVLNIQIKKGSVMEPCTLDMKTEALFRALHFGIKKMVLRFNPRRR